MDNARMGYGIRVHRNSFTKVIIAFPMLKTRTWKAGEIKQEDFNYYTQFQLYILI